MAETTSDMLNETPATLLEQTNGKQSNGKQWTTMKQAPKKYFGVSQTHIKHQKRQQQLAQIKEDKEIASFEIREQANQTANRIDYVKAEAKAEARKNYMIRKMNRPKTNILDDKIEISLNQRLVKWARHHKCTHGWQYNKIAKTSNGFIFGCNHDVSTFVRDTGKECNHCRNKTKNCIKETPCGCMYIFCNRCRFSTYVYDHIDADSGKERLAYQLFDKHSPSQNLVFISPGIKSNTIKDPAISLADQITIDLDKEVSKTIIEKTKSKVDRKNFVRSMLGKKQVSYAKVASMNTEKSEEPKQQTATTSAQKNYDPSILDEVIDKLTPPTILEGKLQGGSSSKLTGDESSSASSGEEDDEEPTTSKKANKKKKFQENQQLDNTSQEKEEVSKVKSIINKIKDQVKSWKQKFITDGLYAKIKDNKIVKEMLSFFDSLIHFLKVIYDYIDMSTLFLLINIIKSYIAGEKYLPTFELMALVYIFKQNELTSARLFQNLKRRNCNPGIFFKEHFGCLTTIIRAELLEHWVDEENGRYKWRGTRRLFNVQPFMFWHKWTGGETDGTVDFSKYTEGSLQSDSLLNMISQIFNSFPSRFGKGLVMASQFCKILLPSLLFVKGVNDVSKIIKNAFESFMEWWSGESSDPQKWLNGKLYTPGNPVNELHATYLLYRSKLLTKNISKDNITPEFVKDQYYKAKIIAEEYVSQHKQYSPFFKRLLDAHAQGLSENGPPRDRPYEPTCLCLQGAAGSGKSTLWPVLVAQSLGLDGEADPVTAIRSTTYTWDEASEYMTGMLNKRVILFDDFGQDKTKNTDALNLIRLITSAPFTINSANIVGPEVKGSFATPELVVLCTNDQNYNSDLVFSKEAVQRRIDLCMEITNKEGINLASKDPQMNVVFNHTFEDLNGKCLNIDQGRAVFTVIDHHKKKKFKELKTTLNDNIKAANLNIKSIKAPDAQDVPVTFPIRSEKYEKLYQEYLTDIIAKQKGKSVKSGKKEAGDYDSLYQHALHIMKQSFIYGVTASSSMAVIGAWFDWSLNAPRELDCTYSRIKHFLWKTLKATVITVGACGILTLVSTLFTHYESGETKTAKQQGKTITAVLPARQEMGADTQFIKNACGQLQRGLHRVNCFFIGDRYILTVKHFFKDEEFKYIPEGTLISIKKSTWNKEMEFEFERSRLIQLKQTPNLVSNSEIREDVVLYKLNDKKFNAEKNIIKHFWNAERDITRFGVTKVDLLKCELTDKEFIMSEGTVWEDKTYLRVVEGNVTYYHEVAHASYQNRDCSCGSPVITSQLTTPILGIHIASCYLGGSLFHFVTRDVLEEAIQNPIDLEMDYKLEMGNIDLLPNNSVLEYMGKVKPAYQHVKTDLRKSEIYELFGPHNTEPAPLSPHDMRLQQRDDYEYIKENFYKKLFSGYEQVDRFETHIFDDATASLIEETRKLKKESIVPQKILSLDEALNGLLVEGNSKIDLSTSPGYPYVTEHLTRKDLIIENDGVLTPTPRIEREVTHFWSNIKQGIVPYTPFILTIKDERIKLNKIYEDVKPRLFANANLLNLIVMRQLCYSHIMAHYHSKDTYSAVRMDRLSLDWHEFFTNLMKVGDVGFDADFKFWDRSIGKLLLTKVMELQLDYLKPDLVRQVGERGYRTIIEWFTAPYYIFQDNLFRATGTLPSGTLVTFQGNSDGNEILHRAAYLYITSKQSPLISSITSYKQHTKGKRGGDDSVQAISSLIKDVFNGITFSDFVNARGMKCTPGDKSDEMRPYKPLKELTFLKNTTGTMNGLYVPHTEIKSLIEIMYWVRINKNNPNKHKATEDNINCAMRGFYFYGPTLYNQIRNKILNEQHYDILTFAEQNRIWKRYGYFPGSHSDYSTKEDQDVINKIHAKEKYSMTIDDNNNMNFVEGKQQAGEDKASENISLKHPSPALPDMEIKGAPVNETPDISSEPANKARVEQLGTTLQETNETIRATLATGKQTFNSMNMRAEGHCNDINWTLQRLEKKYTLIDQLKWDISELPNKMKAIYDLPNDILTTPALKAAFDVTAFFRMKSIRMRVVVRASEFYGGCLVAGFYPSLVPKSQYPEIPFDMSTLKQLGGKNLIASDNQSLEFEVPFRHPYGFTEAPKDCLGQFAIFILNPLRTGAQNPNSVNITVFAAIEDAEFKVPEYVPSALYRSPKFAAIEEDFEQLAITDGKLEAGISNNETYIASTGQVSINDPISKMKPVMLCAGVGLVKEPKVKQFQDHPTDLVQLCKRFKYRGKLGPFMVPHTSSYTTSIPMDNWIQEAIGKYGDFYNLYRGSMLLKINLLAAPVSSNFVDKSYRENINARAYLIQGTTPFDADSEGAAYLGGCSYFDAKEPLEIMVPHMSPLFVTSFGSPDQTLIEQKSLMLVFENFNTSDDINITLESWVCVADDMAFGMFTGTPSIYLVKPAQAKKVMRGKLESGIVEKKIELLSDKEYEWEVKYDSFKRPEPVTSPFICGFVPSTNQVMIDTGEFMNYGEAMIKVREGIINAGIFSYQSTTTIVAGPRIIIDKILKNKNLTRGQGDRIVKYLVYKMVKNIPYTPEEQQAIESEEWLRTSMAKNTPPEYVLDKVVMGKREAGIIDFIDKAVETTLPIAEIIDDLGNLLDAHPITYQPYPIRNKKMGYTISTDQVQYVERMLVTNHNGMNLSDKEAFGGKRRETDMYELMTETLSLDKQITWSTTQSQGQLLGFWNVGPSCISSGFKTSPPIDVISQDFMFWNGSVCYVIEVIAASTHKGQLTVTFHPNLQTPPTSLVQATQQYFTSFDLEKGRATTAIQCPYLRKTQFLPVPNAKPGPYESQNINGSNGIFCLWIQNELRAVNSVADTVDINIYKFAGKDYKVEMFGNNMALSNVQPGANQLVRADGLSYRIHQH